MELVEMKRNIVRIVVLFAVLAAAVFGRAQVTRAWDGDIEDMWVSTEKPGQTQDGVSYSREDVLHLERYCDDGCWYEWDMFFDGSDYGLNSKQHNINSVALNPGDRPGFYFTVSGGPVYIPDVPGKVYANDVLGFWWTDLRAPGGGAFFKVLTGKEMGLNLASEKIDSLAVLDFNDDINFDGEPSFFNHDCQDRWGDDNIYLISTVGNYVVPMANGIEGPVTFLKGGGSDILAFCPANEYGDTKTKGYWYKLFDATVAGVTPRNAIADISLDPSYEPIDDAGDHVHMDFSFAGLNKLSAPGVGTSNLQRGEVFWGVWGSDVDEGWDYTEETGDFNNDGYPRLNGAIDALHIYWLD